MGTSLEYRPYLLRIQWIHQHEEECVVKLKDSHHAIGGNWLL